MKYRLSRETAVQTRTKQRAARKHRARVLGNEVHPGSALAGCGLTPPSWAAAVSTACRRSTGQCGMRARERQPLR